MKVFISWSGDRSRAIAGLLEHWLPNVIQAVKPFFSRDISKGARWAPEIGKALEASRVGLLVITPDNQVSPWLLFEAGALAKSLNDSRVCPLLFGDVDNTDLKGPLAQFQAAKFSKEEMWRVIQMMNQELEDQALLASNLEESFSTYWPKLSDQIDKILADVASPDAKARRTERDLLEEILTLARESASVSERRERPMENLNPIYVEGIQRLAHYLGEMIFLTQRRTPDKELADLVDEMSRILEPLMATVSLRHRLSRFPLQTIERWEAVAKKASMPAEPKG